MLAVEDDLQRGFEDELRIEAKEVVNDNGGLGECEGSLFDYVASSCS